MDASFVHGAAPEADGYRVCELFYRRTNHLSAPPAVRRLAKAGEHLSGLWELRSRLRADGIDVVHVQWAVLRPVERAFYRRLQHEGVPVVFTAHDPLPNVGGDRRRRSVAATARAFERVIVHSEWGRRALVERCGVAPGRIRVIPHGVFSLLAELPTAASAGGSTRPHGAAAGPDPPVQGHRRAAGAWPQVRAAVPEGRARDRRPADDGYLRAAASISRASRCCRGSCQTQSWRRCSGGPRWWRCRIARSTTPAWCSRALAVGAGLVLTGCGRVPGAARPRRRRHAGAAGRCGRAGRRADRGADVAEPARPAASGQPSRCRRAAELGRDRRQPPNPSTVS